MSFQPGEVRRIGTECFWRGHLCTILEGPDQLGMYKVHVHEDASQEDLYFTRTSLREESEEIVKFNINSEFVNFTGK